MASVFSYRGGDCQPIPAQTVPEVGGVQLYPIEVGDLVGFVTVVFNTVTYYNCVVPLNAVSQVSGTDNATSLNSITPNGQSAVSNGNALFTTATQVENAFAGVALHKTGLQANETTARLSMNIDPGWTLIATAGTFEYPCAASLTWKPGDPVIAYISSSVAQKQQVAQGASSDIGINTIGVATPPVNQLGNATVTSTLPGANNTCVFRLRTTLMHQEVVSGT